MVPSAVPLFSGTSYSLCSSTDRFSQDELKVRQMGRERIEMKCRECRVCVSVGQEQRPAGMEARGREAIIAGLQNYDWLPVLQHGPTAGDCCSSIFVYIHITSPRDTQRYQYLHKSENNTRGLGSRCKLYV